MQDDRRKHFRCLTSNNGFVAFGHKPVRYGKLRDISASGLSFEYVSPGKLNEESLMLDIFLPEDKFCVSKVPCKIVYEVPLHRPERFGGIFKNFTSKRCGVEFGAVPDDTMGKLNFFLEDCTTELAIFFR
jgi:hypothetical protein